MGEGEGGGECDGGGVVQQQYHHRLNMASQVRYCLRHLRMLPPVYQSDDSNRITYGFFALSSLAILGALDRLQHQERADYIHWVLRAYHHHAGGFGGAPRQELLTLRVRRPVDHLPRVSDSNSDSNSDQPDYDQPHLTHTYTALLLLALLTVPPGDSHPQGNSPYDNLDVPKLVSFVSQCQRPDGSFAAFPASPDEDVRFVYCAMAVLTMVRVVPSTAINVPSLLSFLKSCSRYEGGYGQSPYAEAQGGTTYCALASLAMLGQLQHALTEEERAKTLRWLVDRQMLLTQSTDLQGEEGLQGTPFHTVAGFQGRIGKPLDACYSFWCTGALAILANYPSSQTQEQDGGVSAAAAEGPATPPAATAGGHASVLFDPEANIQFLLRCQSRQWGGIARAPEDHPDVYHTYLALASLSLSHTASIAQQRHKLLPQGPPVVSSLATASVALSEHDPLLNVPRRVSRWIQTCFS